MAGVFDRDGAIKLFIMSKLKWSPSECEWRYESLNHRVIIRRRASPMPCEIQGVWQRTNELLDDPLRSEVIKAAMPAFYDHLRDTREAIDRAYTEQTVQVDAEQIKGLGY